MTARLLLLAAVAASATLIAPPVAADEPCPCDCAAAQHLDGWLLDARLALAKLLVTRGEKHPDVVAARAEIASLEGASARFDSWGGDTVALRLAEACRDDAVLALTLGPAHPERRAVAASVEVLTSTLRARQGERVDLSCPGVD